MSEFYDFGGKYAQEFESKCNKCKKEISISTQKDENPEYYTDVFVKCKCGGSVSFRLPVNWKMSEFNLSDKIKDIDLDGNSWIKIDEVKELIKRMKEEIKQAGSRYDDLINALAGEKLIWPGYVG